MDTTSVPHFPALAANISADVCVVGAGMAGLSTAYFLARQGARVVVVERAGIGAGETGRTTAHLSNALDHLYSDTESDIGTDGVRMAAASHAMAVDAIERIVDTESIACDFSRVDGYLFVPPHGDPAVLERERAAACRAGVSDVAIVGRAPLRTFDTGACLRFPRQAQFHPLKYLGGLAQAIVRLGGRIFTGTHVSRVIGGAPTQVTAAGNYRISAGSVVVATNSPIHDNLQVHFKQGPYRTYVIAAEIERGSVPQALYWDTADPFHYVRLYHTGAYDLVIAGGEDHRTGDEDDGGSRFESLERWTRVRFPIRQVRYRWSGQVMEAVDGVGLIGRDRLDLQNVYFATGDSGMGMTHGTIAGMLITDLLTGRSNGSSRLYDPTRFPIRSGDFYQENLEVLWHYAEWLTDGDVGTADAIACGEGAVIRRGAGKVAAYRDDNGRLWECSAVCPHLGCIVSWNSTEHSWHCPCHGSRFDARGTVVNGPAALSLRRA